MLTNIDRTNIDRTVAKTVYSTVVDATVAKTVYSPVETVQNPMALMGYGTNQMLRGNVIYLGNKSIAHLIQL